MSGRGTSFAYALLLRLSPAKLIFVPATTPEGGSPEVLWLTSPRSQDPRTPGLQDPQLMFILLGSQRSQQ